MRFGKVEATGGFLLLAAWLNYLDSQGLVPLALLACALHELGHYRVILALGGRVGLVRLTAVGAEMQVSGGLSYWGELAAALGGPLVNLALALFFSQLPGGALFAGLNLVLALFNLLPVGRLDGGRVLYCVMSMLLGPESAERVGRWLDRLLVCGLSAVGLLLAGAGGSVTLLLTSLWLMGCIFRQEKGRKGLAIRPGNS